MFADQYEEDMNKHLNITRIQRRFSLGDTTCIESAIENHSEIPAGAKENVNAAVISGRFAAKALRNFVENIDGNKPIMYADDMANELSYDVLGLKTQHRQPGLRSLEDMQLYALAYMQQHCSVHHKDFDQLKPFIDDEIAESEMYDTHFLKYESMIIFKHISDLTYRGHK